MTLNISCTTSTALTLNSYLVDEFHSSDTCNCPFLMNFIVLTGGFSCKSFIVLRLTLSWMSFIALTLIYLFIDECHGSATYPFEDEFRSSDINLPFYNECHGSATYPFVDEFHSSLTLIYLFLIDVSRF